MAGLRWNQTPEFLAATNTTLVPGGPTAYRVPRRVGNSPQDVTDFHPGQADWSHDNLPSVLYMLESPQSWKDFKQTRKPKPKRDQANQVVYERWPEAGETVRPLRDFRVLPDRIGTKESWWVIEAWKRFDPRIEWPDIMMRMERANRTKREDKRISNSLNMFATRQRSEFGLVSWHPRGIGKLRKARHDKVVAKLTAAQKANNTTRGLTPGLINAALGEAGGRIPCPHDFEADQRKRGPPKRKAKKQDDGEEEDEEGEEYNEEGEEGEEEGKVESSPAPSRIPQGPPRGIFHPTPSNFSQGPPIGFTYPDPSLQNNDLKRRRDDMAEAEDTGYPGRKKIRTTASSARLGLTPTQMAGPIPQNDPRLAADMARYGINLNKRKADDSGTADEPRKRTRRAMADEDYTPPSAPSRATRTPRRQPARFLERLDPALRPSPVVTEPQHREAKAAMEPRPGTEASSVTRATTQAHLPRERALEPSRTRREVRNDTPGAHLPRGRALATTTTRHNEAPAPAPAPAPSRGAHLPRGRAPAGTETPTEGRMEARNVDGQVPGAHLPRARAPETTSTRHSEAPTPAPTEGAHLPGARAQNATEAPHQNRDQASNEEGQAPWEHLPGARTQPTPLDQTNARVLRDESEREERRAARIRNGQYEWWSHGAYSRPQAVRSLQASNYSGSYATYAGNAPLEANPGLGYGARIDPGD